MVYYQSKDLSAMHGGPKLICEWQPPLFWPRQPQEWRQILDFIFAFFSTKLTTHSNFLQTHSVLASPILKYAFPRRFPTYFLARQKLFGSSIETFFLSLGNTSLKLWAVVVAQLVERSLPTSEVRSSNQVIGKIYIK